MDFFIRVSTGTFQLRKMILHYGTPWDFIPYAAKRVNFPVMLPTVPSSSDLTPVNFFHRNPGQNYVTDCSISRWMWLDVEWETKQKKIGWWDDGRCLLQNLLQNPSLRAAPTFEKDVPVCLLIVLRSDFTGCHFIPSHAHGENLPDRKQLILIDLTGKKAKAFDRKFENILIFKILPNL